MTTGTWDRNIDYMPPKGAYDPRWFIEGKHDEILSEYLSRFFDIGSFQETFSGWAQAVVVGRARLGGIPIGIIAVEPRIFANWHGFPGGQQDVYNENLKQGYKIVDE